VLGLVSATMNAAVRDRRIHANPCEGTNLPATSPKRVTPLALEVVEQLSTGVTPWWRAAVTLAASTGMRQGEVLGLTVDRVDFWP
jgi:integrase